MNLVNGRRVFVAVLLLVPVLALLTGARNMPRLQAPGDLAGAAPGESILIDVLANDGVLGEGLVLTQVNRPQHGTALIEGNQVRYTAASSEGQDRFGYMVQLADGRKALGVVDVRVRSLPLGTHLEGLVPAHVGGGATVRLRLGGNVVHETLTRAGGHFTVVWPAGLYQPDTLMSVEVSGHTAAGVPARWYSVLGTIGSFPDGWSGPDGESHWNLRVGPMSTAHHALLSRVMAVPGGTAEDYRKHLPSVDPVMILRVATVFSMLAEGEVALPAGKGDVYALIEDLGALDALVDALPDGVFQARQAALLADRRMIQHYGAQWNHLWAEGYLMAPGGAGLVALAGADVAELSGSQYTLVVPRASNWIQRVEDDGWLRLVMEEPAISLNPGGQQGVWCPGGVVENYRMLRQWDEEALVGLFRGDDVSYLLRVRDVTRSPNLEGLSEECLPFLPEPEVVVERVSALLYDWWESGVRREGFQPGRHHLAAATSATDRTPRSGWVDVGAGSAGFDGRDLYDSPSWSNGWLLGFNLLDDEDGRSDHFATLVRQTAGAQEWVVRVDSSTGEGYSLFSTPGVNADPDLGAIDFTGVWMSGPTVSGLGIGYHWVNEFLVALDVSAGTAEQITRPFYGSDPDVEPAWLEVGDTTITLYSYRAGNGDLVEQCPPGDFDCFPFRLREWQVLRVEHDHFGAGRHLMWVDERVRMVYFDDRWWLDARRVIPYVLTDDPLPVAHDVNDDTGPVLRAEPVEGRGGTARLP